MKKLKNFTRGLIEDIQSAGVSYTLFWIMFLLYFYEIINRA